MTASGQVGDELLELVDRETDGRPFDAQPPAREAQPPEDTGDDADRVLVTAVEHDLVEPARVLGASGLEPEQDEDRIAVEGHDDALEIREVVVVEARDVAEVLRSEQDERVETALDHLAPHGREPGAVLVDVECELSGDHRATPAAAGVGVASSSDWPRRVAGGRRPAAWSAPHIVTWIAVSTGFPSACSAVRDQVHRARPRCNSGRRRPPPAGPPRAAGRRSRRRAAPGCPRRGASPRFSSETASKPASSMNRTRRSPTAAGYGVASASRRRPSARNASSISPRGGHRATSAVGEHRLAQRPFEREPADERARGARERDDVGPDRHAGCASRTRSRGGRPSPRRAARRRRPRGTPVRVMWRLASSGHQRQSSRSFEVSNGTRRPIRAGISDTLVLQVDDRDPVGPIPRRMNVARRWPGRRDPLSHRRAEARTPSPEC